MIHWDNPAALWTLTLLPVAGWLLVSLERRRAQAAARFARAEALSRLMPPPAAWRTWLKHGAVLAGLALLVLAGARPRFGATMEPLAQRSADVLILLDASRSMLAGDVPPNRLGRAKEVVQWLLSEIPGDRVGLVAFAGTAMLKAPLTADHGFVREVLEEIHPLAMPRGGTRIGDALRKALDLLPASNPEGQAIVLITDGEDHGSRPEEAAQEAARRGVRILTISLGDPQQGARIPVQRADGTPGFLTYEGQEVWSRADEALLQRIAATTGGVFLRAGGGETLFGPAWAELFDSLARRDLRQQRRIIYADQFQWFAGAGLLLLLLDALMPRYPPNHSRAKPLCSPSEKQR